MTGTLKPTCDRKTRFRNGQKNTYGLMPGLEGTCPHATTAPGGCWCIEPGRKLSTCYVARTMNAYKNVAGVLEHNTKLLMNADSAEMIEIIDAEIQRFRKSEMKQDKPKLQYRLHWAGDVFSETYALALATVIKKNSDIEFWCYTRSFFAVKYLCNLPNLILFLSLDPVNAQQGILTYEEYKGDNNLQMCYMSHSDDFETQLERARPIMEGRNALRKMLGRRAKSLKWMYDMKLRVCPVDVGKLNLEQGCPKCGRCLKKPPSPVWFKD